MLDKQQTYLDHDRITIKIILGNLLEEDTVCKDTFMNIFSCQVIRVFCKIPLLLSFIRPILRYPLSVKITGFIPLRQKHLWDLMLNVVTELLVYIVTVQLFLFIGFGRLVLGLLSVYSDYCYIYFILLLETVFVLFCDF